MDSGVDARALDALIRKVRTAAGGGGLYDRVKTALAAEALTQVALGFREGRAPDGEAWAPLKVRRGRPLRDTGRLLNSFSYEILPTGFRIGTKTFYARVHQYGRVIVPRKAKLLRFPIGRGARKRYAFARKVNVPARPMVPSEGRLTPLWARAFRRAALLVTRRYWSVTR
jgi:phage gpG-like protein